jgi:hypothetical protein
MYSRRKPSAAALQSSERRGREDASERLIVLVPRLASLELAIDERRGDGGVENRHVRRFVVERAPAHFELPCTGEGCVDGGHDVTRQVADALRRGATRFDGEHACNGNVGANACSRVLHFVGTATYKP